MKDSLFDSKFGAVVTPKNAGTVWAVLVLRAPGCFEIHFHPLIKAIVFHLCPNYGFHGCPQGFIRPTCTKAMVTWAPLWGAV